MSNVLIGIIGVILFIGIAIAGALFLGDQFKSVTSKSDASTIMAQLAQMTQALEMYKLKSGKGTVNCQTVDFLVPRYLKRVPVSPTLIAANTQSSYLYKPQLNNDLRTDATPEQAAAVEALYITTNIGATPKAAKACQAIADQYGGGVQTVTALPTSKAGCGLFQDEYVAWQKL
jgi:hypothetical protein